MADHPSFKDALEVVAHRVDGQEFVPGFSIYGFTGCTDIPDFDLPTLSFTEKPHYWRLVSHCWTTGIWDFPITHWPDDDTWRRGVRHLFDAVLTHHNSAWMSYEGNLYIDPPYLFSPEHMPETVLCWATANEASPIPSLDAPFEEVDDASLLRLRDLTPGATVECSEDYEDE